MHRPGVGRQDRRHADRAPDPIRLPFLTDFADQAVLLPLVAVVALVLLAQGWPRGAAAWVAAACATFAAMLALKLALVACGAGALRSPSGHAAAAAMVYGGLAGLLARGRRPVLAPTLLAAAAAAALIGASRLALGVHSPAEVAVGAAVGIAGAAGFARLAGPAPPLRVRPMLAGLLAVLVTFHGLRLPAEAAIGGLAAWLWPAAACAAI